MRLFGMVIVLAAVLVLGPSIIVAMVAGMRSDAAWNKADAEYWDAYDHNDDARMAAAAQKENEILCGAGYHMARVERQFKCVPH